MTLAASRWTGPGLVLVFAVSQALRDVYFSGVFQGVNRFAVILTAFSISIAFCAVRAWRRTPEQFALAACERRAFFWMNVTTAIAWSSYFSALQYLQPSVVNTLHSATGPLTVVLLGACGVHFAKPAHIGRLERGCYAGLAATMILLWWVALTGRSGLAADSNTLWALALLLVSGSSITTSLLMSRKMADRGIGADVLTVGRYPLIVLVALVALAIDDRPAGFASPAQFAGIAIAAVVLIALPLYLLQLGIATTAPLTGHVIRSLGPVFVFALELFDSRIGYSGATLACIVLYCVFAIGANLARMFARD